MLRLECSTGLVRIFLTGAPGRRDVMCRMVGLRLSRLRFRNTGYPSIGQHNNFTSNHGHIILLKLGPIRSNNRIGGELNRSSQRATGQILRSGKHMLVRGNQSLCFARFLAITRGIGWDFYEGPRSNNHNHQHLAYPINR